MREEALDIIKEIINIGIGEAANALSQLVNTRVIIQAPDVHIIDVADIHEYIQNEMTSLGVYMSQGFEGIAKGKTLLFYTKECSISLLNAVSGGMMKTTSLTETGIATLNELGNIIMGACMAEIGNMIEEKIVFDLPEVTVEISENYFQNLLKELEGLDKAILVKNVMRIKESDIEGYLFILLSFEDFRMVIDSLEKKMKTA